MQTEQVESHACYNTCCNIINNANEIPVSNARNVRKKKKIQLGVQCIWFISPLNPFFFCVLTQQGVNQTKTYCDTLRYTNIKYLESGFSNNDGPAKYAVYKNTISRWIKIKVYYIAALEHLSNKTPN